MQPSQVARSVIPRLLQSAEAAFSQASAASLDNPVWNKYM